MQQGPIQQGPIHQGPIQQGPIQQGVRPGYPNPADPPYTNGPSYPQSPIGRPHKQQQEGGYRESPPPPPPPTSTHPLYQQTTRYTASMGELPRGGYYAAANNAQPRPYQLQGTNPWEREEKEKVCASDIVQSLFSLKIIEWRNVSFIVTTMI